MENKTLSFKYEYLDRNDERQSVTVKYNLPIRVGSKGLDVQIIKYFLGIGDLSSTGPEFDPITENALVQFQEDNRQRIFDYGDYGFSTEGLLDNMERDGEFDVGAIIAEELLEGATLNVDLPGGFLTERGQVFEPTFKTMIDLGLNRAATDLIRRPGFAEYLARPPGSVDPSAAFNTKNEEQDPPKIGNEFVTYAFDTRITRQQHLTAGSQDINQYFQSNPHLPAIHLRNAVKEVFDFYGKEKVWVVNAAERTFIPIVSPLQDAIDDGDLPRRLFEEILVYQRRVESPPGFVSGQEFKFTINQMSLNDQMNGDKIDVLFGQSLLPGAKPIFASIESIVSPGARPSATYKLRIKIRKDMFNQIRGGSGAADFGGTVNVLDPNNIAAAAAGYKAAEKFVTESLNQPFKKEFWTRQGNAIKSGARKWRDGQRQKAEKAVKDSLRNSWNKAKTGQSGASPEDIDKNTQKEIEAQNSDTTAKRLENGLVNPATYNVGELKKHLEFLSEQVAKFDKEMKEFERDNKDNPTKPRKYNKFRPPPAPPIVPQISPINESKRILNLATALEEFLDANGRTLRVGPNNEDELLIYYDIVKKEVPAPQNVDPSLQPALENQDQISSPLIEVEVGHRIYKVVYIDKKANKQKELTAGLNLFTTRDPFIYPTTVSYLFSLCRKGFGDKDDTPRILKFLRPNPCRDTQSIPAVIFFSRFHYPTPKFTFRKGKRKGINVGFDFDIRGIKTVEEHIKEQRRLAGQSVDNLLQSTFFEQKGKIIDTADVYPKFGELACNFEDMWRDFLQKWDPQMILCDYKKCVPGLEDIEFNIDLKFDIPALPKLPTFNPLNFVLPQIKIAFADMIMSFICEFVKNMLEAISYPDCVDALQYGAAKFSELNAKNENNPFADAQQKADMATKTSEVLNNLNISQDILFGEDESSIGSLFDAISLVLRPSELCDLLQGDASPGVLKVVLNVVRSSNSELKKVMTTVAEVSEFFRVLGQVVDPYLCDRLREIQEVVVADALCDERSGMAGLRNRLQGSGLTSAEIAKEMEAANKRRDALRDIASSGNFDSLLPSGNTPSKLAEKNLPGPLSNPHHDRVAKTATAAILSNIENVFTLEAPGIPDQMVDRDTQLIKPGETGFNDKDYIYFRHYVNQVANLEQGIPARKTGKLRVKSTVPLELLQYRTSLNEIGVADEEFEYIRFYFEDNSEDAEAVLIDVSREVDPEKAEQFSELVQKHVSDYVSKYSKDEFKVFPELKEISSQDLTTITRKTSSTMGSPYRELHTRVATRVMDSPLRNVDVDSKSNTPTLMSVGYSDMPFISSKMKDCYRVSYIVNDVSRNAGNVYFNKVYKDRLPPEYIAMRSQSADIISEKHPDKLLRPGGFADLFINGLKSISDNRSQTNLDLYENDTIRNHLSGFIESGGSLELDRDNDGEITGQERLVYLLNLIAVTAASRQDGFSIYEGYVDSFNYHLTDLVKNSKYFSYDEMFQLQRDIGESFNVEGDLQSDPCYVPNPKLLNFDEIVEDFLNSYANETEKPENDPVNRDFSETGPFQKSIASGLFGLYVKFSCLEVVFKSMFLFSNFGPKGVFGTQFMIDYIVNYVANDINNRIISTSFRKKVMKAVKEITLIDDEQEAIRSLILRNIDTSSIEEFVTKLFDNRHMSFEEKIRNEIAENVKNVPSVNNFPKLILRNSESSLNDAERQEQERLYESVYYYLELLKVQNDMVFPEMSTSDVANRVAELRRQASVMESVSPQAARALRRAADQLENPDVFEMTPQQRREAFVDEQRRASDLINNLNGFKEVPVSATIPNIYDKFAFDGYSEELIQKKINSGHFWMERFYRIKDFQEFYRLYSELFLAVNSDPIFQNLPHIGTSAETSLYSEYISPEDLESLLLGTEDTNTRQESLQSLADNLKKNQLEYDFTKSFYLKMLSNFFAGRPNAIERRNRPQGHKRAYLERRIQKSTVIKMMIDLGFAMKNEGIVRASNTESGGKIFGFDSAIEGYGSNYGREREMEAAAPIEPVGYLTDIDYAYRSGAVTKEQLIDRMLYIIDDVNLEDEFNENRVMARSWSNNIPEDEVGVYNQQQMPESDGFKVNFGTLGAYKFLGRQFVFEQERYSDNPGYKYKDIPRRRKAELIVNCLTNMMDIIYNWPTSTDEPQQNLKTRVFWRTDEQTQQGSGYYSRVKSLFERVAYAKRSIDYVTPWYNNSGLRSDPVYSMRILDTASAAFIGISTEATPFYKEDVTIQNDVLDYYISRAYTPALDQTTFSNSKITGGALAILRPVEWSQLSPEERADLPISLFYESQILPRQKALYDFLKNNLQVGARLMMGQKVSRQYESPPTITNENQDTATGIGTVMTEPSKIFKDFTPNLEVQKDILDASDRTIGLLGDSSIFNRKKCFLAYADKEKLTTPDNPTGLNYKSAFYNIASTAASIAGFGSATNASRTFGKLYDDDIKNVLVYSVPIYEHVEDVKCLDDVYSETHNTQTQDKLFYPMVFSSNTIEYGSESSQSELVGLEKRREVIRNSIYEMHKDSLVKNVLSLGDTNQNVNSRPIDKTNITHPANIMFNIVFPLNRYVGIHALQNNVVFDRFKESDDLFGATKVACLGLMGVAGTAHDVTAEPEPQLSVNEIKAFEEEKSLGDYWTMFTRMLERLVKQSYARMVRTTGRFGDPAYADMRKQYRENPCDMKTGLNSGLVGGSLFEYDGSTLDKGFGTKNGKKQYVPVNALPLDILLASLPLPDFRALGKVGQHVAGIATQGPTRYGYPLGPFGVLALSAPELTAERLSTIKEKKQCKNPGAPSPQGLCEDKGEDES